MTEQPNNTLAISMNRKVLVIDDTAAIHDDYRYALRPARRNAELDAVESALFGESDSSTVGHTLPEFTINVATQGEQGVAMARIALSRGEPYAMAFVDMRMPPGLDGLQTARELWKIDPSLHICICTAFSDQSLEEILGAAERPDQLLILRKPFEAVEVMQVAVAMTEKWNQAKLANASSEELQLLIEQRTQQLEEALHSDRMRLDLLESIVAQRTAELRRAATHDRLTGLPNRSYFQEALVEAIEKSQRDQDYKFAVLFLDFDRFKVVNDSLGHAIGDELLISISDRLKSCLRLGANEGREAQDVAARLGGDEFVALITSMNDYADVDRVVNRLIETLGRPHIVKGHIVTSTASIGVATAQVTYTNADDVLRDADIAMYRAKSRRNCAVWFHPRMHTEAMDRLTLEAELRSGFERDELFMTFQPIVSLDEGMLGGFESLVRWQHPRLGVLSPWRFVPLTEEIHLATELFVRTLDLTCKQIAAWEHLFPNEHTYISCNLATSQISQRGLVEHVAETLQKYSIRPGRLGLEITESFLAEDAARVAAVVGGLRKAGARILIDDFGTGHSALARLPMFEFDLIKLDRSFVSSAATSRRCAAVAHAVAQLARNLGADVVVEGIETVEQLAMMQALSCQFGQGYFFARPLEAAAAAELLHQRWTVAGLRAAA